MAGEDELEAGAAGMAPWQKLLGAALRARAEVVHRRERPPRGAGAGGCLRRVIVIIVLLAFALVMALFLFGRALIHGLQPY